MKKLLCLIFVFASLTMAAQSHFPDIKIQPKQPKSASKDTSGYDEGPYFLLIDQSEKALAEQDYDAAGLRLVEAMAAEPATCRASP